MTGIVWLINLKIQQIKVPFYFSWKGKRGLNFRKGGFFKNDFTIVYYPFSVNGIYLIAYARVN